MFLQSSPFSTMTPTDTDFHFFEVHKRKITQNSSKSPSFITKDLNPDSPVIKLPKIIKVDRSPKRDTQGRERKLFIAQKVNEKLPSARFLQKSSEDIKAKNFSRLYRGENNIINRVKSCEKISTNEKKLEGKLLRKHSNLKRSFEQINQKTLGFIITNFK